MSEHDINIVSALNLVGNKMKLRSKTSQVLKKDNFEYNDGKTQIIGGDSKDFSHERHPAIIIEKDGEQMSKIIVRCPCGRHSELICEYEDDIGPVTESQVGEEAADGEAEQGQAEQGQAEQAQAAETDESADQEEAPEE